MIWQLVSALTRRCWPALIYEILPAAIFVLLLLTLVGCSGIQKVEEFSDALKAGDVDTAREITSKDIRLALALAEQVGDEAAMACYPALEACADAILTVRERGQSEDAGIVTAYQRARNVRLLIDRDTTMCGRKLHLACSAMLDESGGTLRRILGVIAR